MLIRQSQSAIAFGSLFEAGNELSNEERLELAHRALNELAARAEISKAPYTSLREIEGARTKAALLGDAGIKRAMEAMETRVAAEVVYTDVHAVRDFMERGQWGQAANRSNVRLLQPNLPADVKSVLTEVVRVGRHLDALDQLQSAMRSSENNRPGDIADTLQRINSESLSAVLEGRVRRLRGLTELRAAAEIPWGRPPRVDSLLKSLADLQEADQELSSRVQQELAVKMLLEGHSHEARAMLPKHGSQENAAALLRDLNAVLRGNQEVKTAQVRQVVSATEWSLPGRPPVGLRPFMAVNDRSKWQPPSKSANSDKPPPLEALARKESTLREQVRDALETERQTALDNGAESLARVRALDGERSRFDEEDRRLFAELESLVQRRITPADRYVARHCRREGKSPSEIISLLGPAMVVDDPVVRSSSAMDLDLVAPDQRSVHVVNLVAAGALGRPVVFFAVDLVVITEIEMNSDPR